MQNPPPPNNVVPPVQPIHQIPDDDDDDDDSSDGSALAAEDVPLRLPVLRALQSQHDPQRMVLTAQERRWAVTLKDQIDMIPDVDNPTDYWLAQTALVCQGDLSKGVGRLCRLMEFRVDIHNISDEETYDWTPEQALAFIEQGVIRSLPGVLLFFHYCPQEETYIYGVDVRQFDFSRVTTSEQKLEEFVKGMYFLYQALSPDLETVRKGTITMLEWDGVDWSFRPGFNWGASRNGLLQLFRYFPMNRKKVNNYHTGAAANALVDILKTVFPSSIANKFEVGCQLEGRMDALFMIPTVEAATERLLSNIKEALQIRHRNEKNFTLNHPLSWQRNENDEDSSRDSGRDDSSGDTGSDFSDDGDD